MWALTRIVQGSLTTNTKSIIVLLKVKVPFGHAVATQKTNLCFSQPHYGLHPTMFFGNNSLVICSDDMYSVLRSVNSSYH